MLNSTIKLSKIFVLITFILAFTLLFSCNSKDKKQTSKFNFPYKIDKPDIIYHLPKELSEISGISFYKKNKIACIQDEQAIIFIYDIKKQKLSSKIDFGKNNDYEDIAITKNTAYVLRSDGTIFIVEDFDKKKKRKIKKIETQLGSKNNTEGLFYDKKNNTLLIACKGSPSINKKEKHKGFKAIYKLDLETKHLKNEPEYLINLSYIDSLSNISSLNKFIIKNAQKIKLLDYSFQPSGLAISPINTDNIYILSSNKRMLIIINLESKIKRIINLNSRIFNQPEGICFSKNGDLYISNEGKNGKGNILKFERIIN